MREIFEFWNTAPEKVANEAQEALGGGYRVFQTWDPTSNFVKIVVQQGALTWAFSRPEDLARFVEDEIRQHVKHLNLDLFDEVMGWAEQRAGFEVTMEEAFKNCLRYDSELADRFRAHLKEINDRRLLEVWQWAEEAVAE